MNRPRHPGKAATLIALFIAGALCAGFGGGHAGAADKKQAARPVDRRVFLMDAAEVAGISIQRGGRHLRLIKENSQWHFVVPERKDADPRKVGTLVASLTALEWKKPARAAPRGPAAAEITLENYDNGGRKVRVSFTPHETDTTLLVAVRQDGAYMVAAIALSLPGTMEDLLP